MRVAGPADGDGDGSTPFDTLAAYLTAEIRARTIPPRAFAGSLSPRASAAAIPMRTAQAGIALPRLGHAKGLAI